MTFSVIIPTLQRSGELPELVEMCVQHALVREVIIINNAPQELVIESAKVSVLDQPENIYVNPAWNLGVSRASGEYIAIINDDLLFDPIAFDISASILKNNIFGIVGPDKSCFDKDQELRPGYRIARRANTVHGYGTFMALRRNNYSRIPEEMRIWGGDDWLIATSPRPPACLVGVRFETEMGTTSSSSEFQQFRASETAIADRIVGSVKQRWWRRPLDAVEHIRIVRHRIRTVLSKS